jgi:hypothetical protein
LRGCGAGTPGRFSSNIGEVLPLSVLRKVEQHPHYQAILKRFGIDRAWCDEPLTMADDLSPTPVSVRPDDDLEMYELYYYPGNASLHHFVLEEIGAPFVLRRVERTQCAKIPNT